MAVKRVEEKIDEFFDYMLGNCIGNGCGFSSKMWVGFFSHSRMKSKLCESFHGKHTILDFMPPAQIFF